MHQAVGLMACLVWREKSDTGARVSAELEGPVGALREAAKRVAKVSLGRSDELNSMADVFVHALQKGSLLPYDRLLPHTISRHPIEDGML